jgi:diaminopimelate decarboxylase
MMDWFSSVTHATMAHVLGQVMRDPRLCEQRAIVFHDLEALRNRLQLLKDAFDITPRGAPLHAVAIKANPIVAVLKEVVAAGGGLEAASLEEVSLALAAGCPPKRVVYDSPAKRPEEIRQALKWGVNLNADSADELARIDTCWDPTRRAPWVALRINPEVGAGTVAATSVATAHSKFGIPISAGLENLLTLFRQYGWLTGLHVHVGSQGCALELLVEGVRRAMELRRELHQRLGREQIRVVDIGGGLPWNYSPQDHAPSPADYVRRLRQKVPELFDGDVQLVTELGRAVQAGCGWAASRVEYVKSAGGQPLAVIHLGADFLLRPVYQPSDWHHEISLFDAQGQPKQGPRHPVSVVGPLCFAGDILAVGRHLPHVAVGDWLVLHDVGAYAIAMWSRHCSRAMPPVVGHEGPGPRLRMLLTGESLTDVQACWSR